MKAVLLIFLFAFLSAPNIYAQELASVDARTVQIKSIDPAAASRNFVMPVGNRKKGVACLVTGGVFIVAGISMLAAASKTDLVEPSLWGPAGVACVGAGIVTFVVGGFNYLASGPGGNGHYSGHISVYGDPNRLGLAYNF